MEVGSKKGNMRKYTKMALYLGGGGYCEATFFQGMQKI